MSNAADIRHARNLTTPFTLHCIMQHYIILKRKQSRRMRHCSAVFGTSTNAEMPNAGDDISGMASDYVGVDVPAGLCDSRLKVAELLDPLWPDRFAYFCAVFNNIFQPTRRSW